MRRGPNVGDDYQIVVFFFCIGNVGDPNSHVLAINHAALWVGGTVEFLLAHQYCLLPETA